LTFSFKISKLLSKYKVSTQPQPFGVGNEEGNPKGADIKPPRGFYLLGG
jgi:hypothetical protein